MEKSFQKILQGYRLFRKKYTDGDQSVMQYLSRYGQKPEIMVTACCDSRVDPALILQCDPGDLFVVRNVANIIPSFEDDEAHHDTSAALEFGIRFLKVKHLILLGHSQCGGIQALLNNNYAPNNDFIKNWVSLIKITNLDNKTTNMDDYAKLALQHSYQNCLTFPCINEKISKQELSIHRWFFDIKTGEISTYSNEQKIYKPLIEENLTLNP
jgi:carbonic anhydrase